MTDIALKICDLNKTYSNGVQALKGVNLCVKKGEFFALLGPNGAGKSTLIGILTSTVQKTSGHVEVMGQSIDQNFAAAKLKIGIVPQEFNFNIFETPLTTLINQAGYYGVSRPVAKERGLSLLKDMGLTEKKDDQIRFLSGGMKRRLMIARALIHDPDVIVLDEPTAGVDIELRRLMWKFISRLNNEEGKTVILTTHYLEEAEALCEKIAIIHKGEVAEFTDMASLLKKLKKETFIFDLHEKLHSAPVLTQYKSKLLTEHELEVEKGQDQSLTDLVQVLNEQGLTIKSMRNKANRLEEMFVSIINQETQS